MSRARMALGLARRGCVVMAQEIAAELSEEQAEQGLAFDKLGNTWRKVYAVLEVLGEVRAELMSRLTPFGGTEDPLLDVFDEVREDIGAYCTNYVRPANSRSNSAVSLEGTPIKPQPCDADIVRLPAEAIARTDGLHPHSGNSIAAIDRIGRAIYKLRVNGHPDLADLLMASR